MRKLVPFPSSETGDDLIRNYPIEGFVEAYRDGRLTRREFLNKLTVTFGSAAMASTFLAACAPTPTATPVPPTATAVPTAAPTARPTAAPSPTAASAATKAPAAPTAPIPTVPASVSGSVSADDPAVEGKMVEYDAKGAKIAAYLAKPKGNGPFPIVLICHENRGLTEHFKDVPRRFAKAGYAALAVDLLSREGGSAKVGYDAAPSALSAIPPERNVEDFRAGMVYMQSQPFVNKARVGMTGFCFGGAVAWRVATQIPEVKAVVPFYGANPPLEDVGKIKSAVLALYGGTDTRINAGIPAIEEAMKKENKTFEKIIYDGAGHAFFNDTGAAYNANAAKDAWAKMLAWFEKYLTG
jgi:carboxymethylenebutenolidase